MCESDKDIIDKLNTLLYDFHLAKSFLILTPFDSKQQTGFYTLNFERLLNFSMNNMAKQKL